MLRKLLLRLPAPVRHRLIRRMFRFSPERCERIEVRYAQTADEYRQAFALVYEEYERAHYFRGLTGTRPQLSRRLFFPHAALPTSTVMVALDGGRVVGTCTLVRDSGMGLPGWKLFGEKATQLGARGERLSELSLLAVARSHRKSGEVLFTLLRYAGLFYADHERTDLSLCTTHVPVAEMLRALMLFQPVFTKPVLHPRAGTPALGVYVDFRDVEQRARRAYRGAARERDLPRFFFDDGRAKVRFPQAPWYTTYLPKLAPAAFAEAFGAPEDLHENVSERDLLVLRNAFSPAMREALPGWFPAGKKPDRELRYDAHLQATLRVGGATSSAHVAQVSASGALLTTDERLQVGQSIALEAALGPGRTSHVVARVVRVANPRQYGLALTSADATWGEYVQFLEGWIWGAPAAVAVENAQPLAG